MLQTLILISGGVNSYIKFMLIKIEVARGGAHFHLHFRFEFDAFCHGLYNSSPLKSVNQLKG